MTNLTLPTLLLPTTIVDGDYDRLHTRVVAPTTFQELGESWASGVRHERYKDHIKLKKSARDDVYRLEEYVYPLIGHIALREFKLEHAKEVLAAAPTARQWPYPDEVNQLLACCRVPLADQHGPIYFEHLAEVLRSSRETALIRHHRLRSIANDAQRWMPTPTNPVSCTLWVRRIGIQVPALPGPWAE